MRLETLQIKGVLAFKAPVAIDFRDLPAGLIAVIGKNGEGKTTLLEAGIAPIGRAFPSRPDKSIVDYALDQDSFIEATYAIAGRGEFRARLNLDGLRRQSDAILEQRVGGTSTVLNDGKLTTFDQAVSREFPPRDLLLASAFASQNRAGSFITLDKKGRRELFSTLLGLDHYDAISQTATTAGKLVAEARVKLIAVRDALSRELPAGALADLDVEAHRLQIDGGQAESRQHELDRTLADLEDQIALCGDATAAYAAASLRGRDLDHQLATRQRELAALLDTVATLATTCERQRHELQYECLSDLTALDRAIANNQGLVARTDEIREAVTRLDALTTQIAALEHLAQQRTADVDGQMSTLAALDRRLATLASKRTDLQRTTTDAKQLRTVPCGGEGTFAGCRFLTNASAAAKLIPALEADLAALEPVTAERTAANLALTATRTALLDLRARITKAKDDQKQTATTAVLAEKLAAHETRIEELTRHRDVVQERADRQLADLQRRTEAERDRLHQRRGELDELIHHTRLALHAAQSDLLELAKGNDRVADLRRYLSDARAEYNDVQRTLGACKASAVALTRRRADLLAKMAQRSELSGQIAGLELTLSEFQLIARMCGREGLPTLEIDAAGPTVSAYTNDILSMVMPRFTVELVTQEARLSKGKDGSTHKEVFDLKVLDNDEGGERAVSDLSGGQQVIVDEALKSALAVHANSRNIAPIETCWRDETTGALHPETAPLYIQMLRRTHELSHAHQTIFVTHSPDAAALADCQLHVHDGQVDIVYPPYAA